MVKLARIGIVDGCGGCRTFWGVVVGLSAVVIGGNPQVVA